MAFFGLFVVFGCYAEDSVQFNTNILDVDDKNNLDLSQFAKKGFIFPGTYPLMVQINGQNTSEMEVVFRASERDPDGSEACLTKEIVTLFGLKASALSKMEWDKEGKCLNPESLDGITVDAVLATSSLSVGIPQAYLEYSDKNWDPPSRWDHGVAGLLFDYYINARAVDHQHTSNSRSEDTLSGNGTAGANLGAWRFRADWQLIPDQDSESVSSELEWSRYYAYRPLPSLGAKLIVGEDYLDSDIFDSFRFTGAAVKSDDSMLPPSLRGYAPEVTGIAKSNARVTISQQGRVLYETQVASGPFSIQNISNAVSGKLDVKISETDGSVREFQVNTASVPYLTRPGTVRYSTAFGRASSWSHSVNGPFFAAGEFSWGVSNGWSVFGGSIVSDDYQAAAVGVGRDLFVLGALSFDITQSKSSLPGQQNLQGKSFRLDYSKSFDELSANVTFAGYRFSEENFMSMDEFLDALDTGERSGGRKEMYTVTANKRFDSVGLSAYLNYSHETYWSEPDSDHYSISASRSFDIGALKNITGSLSAFQNMYDNETDKGMYISLSVPWNNGGTVSYNLSESNGKTEQQASYYKRLNDRTHYQVRAGYSGDSNSVSANVAHNTDIAQVNADVSYRSNEYTEVGVSLQGGITATLEGAALHRTSRMGEARLMIDTDGVPNVPVRGYGAEVYSNRFGKSVLSDVSSYYRNSARVDINKLDEHTEVTRSVVELTMTEGAIGYRHFDVISGAKGMAVIRLPDGSYPPFGATIQNARRQEIGLVNDSGNVYLSGINAGDTMSVFWDGKSQCEMTIPDTLLVNNTPPVGQSGLLLTCSPVSAALSVEL